MPGQHRNVFAALTQRGHGQPHDRQPVIQILAELPGANGFVQVAIRGRDQPDVDLDSMRPTHPFKFALLQHAQQLHLQRRGQLSDLVQKYHAAIGNLQASFLLDGRAGERAALVPE